MRGVCLALLLALAGWPGAGAAQLVISGPQASEVILGRVKLTDGTDVANVTAGGKLEVTCDNCGGGSGGTSATDESAYTPTTSTGTPIMGAADETAPDAAAEGTLAILRSTLNRALHVNLRDAAGAEVAVGGGTQYDEDTATQAAEKLTMAGVVRQDTAAALVGADQDRTVLSVDGSGRLWVNCGTGCSGGTQYNQGTATTDPDALTLAGAVRRDTAAVATGVVDGDRLALSTDSVGRLRVTAADTTQPISASSLPLPTGAATAANQDGILRDGAGDTTQANVSSGRLHVDGSGVTQPVSAASLPLPTGAATEATLATRLSATDFTNVFGAATLLTLTQADNLANTTDSLNVSGLTYVFDGSTWDRWTGAVTLGAALPAGTNNIGDVDVLTLPSVTIGTFPDNEPFNVAQFGGAAVVTGTGASGAGIPRVTVASDSTVTANAGTGTFTVAGAKSDNGGVPGATNLGTLPAVATAAAPTRTEGNQVGLSVNLAGELRTAGGGGGLSVTDSAAWTAASSAFTPAGGEYNPLAAPLASGQQGTQALTANRALHASLRNEQGAAIGTKATPLVVQPAEALPPSVDPVTGQAASLGLSGRTATVKAGGKMPEATDQPVVVALSPVPQLQCPFLVSINQTASTRLAVGVAGKRVMICTFATVSATAQSISLVEGTGSICATGISGIYGGTTASVAFAANGGSNFVSDRIMLPGQGNGNDVCLLQSGAGNVSGTVTYGLY